MNVLKSRREREREREIEKERKGGRERGKERERKEKCVKEKQMISFVVETDCFYMIVLLCC